MKANRRDFLKASLLALGAGLAVPVLAKPRRENPVWDGVVYQAVITCPVCKTQETVTMPAESPLRVYHCPVCLTWLSPKKGDHCIFESYGSTHCAQLQIKERRQKGLPI
jgi:TAT (twin-arginine translocation) pathway signal sequence